MVRVIVEAVTSAKPTTAEGTFLRVRREMLGLTIDQACEGTPIRRSKWGDVERGRTRPSGLRGQPGEWHAPGSVVAVMAARLGVTPAELREAGREDAALVLEALALGALVRGYLPWALRLAAELPRDHRREHGAYELRCRPPEFLKVFSGED